MLPDIDKKIREDFTPCERGIVIGIFEHLIKEGCHIGVDQILRSFLYLSEGDINKIIYYYKMHCIDPRDVVGEAEEKAGNPGHWFAIPFDEMDTFSGELPVFDIRTDNDGEAF